MTAFAPAKIAARKTSRGPVGALSSVPTPAMWTLTTVFCIQEQHNERFPIVIADGLPNHDGSVARRANGPRLRSDGSLADERDPNDGKTVHDSVL
jgi:hypothetical protein